ncbi:capsule biosynthesis GfcC D2 domain-containing protein [Vibrio penaeicida]|uniref:capsule biosynthesis GfcC D2 domain-containing protein n=1 Tax=Vibrio penaeicida TaxID=104609 RepID=UPI000CEA3F9C|nr:capsule biosynthesis GfcC D2 domain-containing protein [Vibrio penaeicida]
MRTLFTSLLNTLLACTLVFSTLASSHQLTVHLPSQKLNLNYMLPSQLSQVIADTQAQNKEALFFEGGALASAKQQAKVDSLKHSIFKRLTRENSEQSLHLLNQLKAMHFVGREWVSLDYDLVRLKPELNPLLSGRYDFYVSPRSNQVRILGHVKNPTHTPLLNGRDITAYLNGLELSEFGDLDQTYIIHANGDLIHAKLAYWQPERYYISPGSKIFIGSRDTPETNKDIAQLLRYAVDK